MKKPVVVAVNLVYWVGYCLLLLVIYAMAQASGPHHPPFAFFTKMMVGFTIIPGLTGFYLSYTFLYDRFLSKKKIIALFFSGFLVALVCGIVGEIALSVILGGVGADRGKLIFPNYEPSEIAVAVFLTGCIGFVNGILGLFIKGFITAYKDITLKEELNKKNYEMELALVKNQINPHFLFNTINNIDVMITKDATQASAYLNKLSDIMRFMLYETKTEKIPLSKELTYIEKYIDLQKIRTSNINYVNYQVEGDGGNLVIAPMLFIPFIENAFKHAENKKLDNAVNIKLTLSKEMIVFECENKFSNIATNNDEQSGLGNELIAKRLQLLYPNKHTLHVTNKNLTYSVKLVVLQA
ncbi:MAG TPA: histidine kinase [Bacteroidia bacterium]|jgi:two-component system LytT family sensor kinase|nr:histidine kinase [Bacteroidia bacterium]